MLVMTPVSSPSLLAWCASCFGIPYICFALRSVFPHSYCILLNYSVICWVACCLNWPWRLADWKVCFTLATTVQIEHYHCVLLYLSPLGPGIQRQGTADSSQPLISSDCVCQCNETPNSVPSTCQSETETQRHAYTHLFFSTPRDKSQSNTTCSVSPSLFV